MPANQIKVINARKTSIPVTIGAKVLVNRYLAKQWMWDNFAMFWLFLICNASDHQFPRLLSSQ